MRVLVPLPGLGTVAYVNFGLTDNSLVKCGNDEEKCDPKKLKEEDEEML